MTACEPGEGRMQTPELTAPQTLAELPFLSAERFGQAAAQRFKREVDWQDLTYTELRDVTREIALGLLALGVEAGDRVCVLADTRPEWVQVEFGIVAAGAVVVPIYASSSREECEWVVGDSGAVAVICENAGQLAKIEQIRQRLPELRDVVVIDPVDARTLTVEGLRARGREADSSELERRTAAVQPDDLAFIVYTSGTTGRPKGCVLTHRNMTSCCRVTQELNVIGGDDVAYLFLPLAHVFAQVVQLSVAAVGGVVAYCSGDVSAILPDCAGVRPTCLPSVPRVFEKVYTSVASQVPGDMLAKGVAAGQAARQMMAAGQPVPEELRRGFEQADAQLFARVRAVFGGRVRVAISGAAPIAPNILEFFHAAGVPVYEGYGLSESASVGTLNAPGAARIGTIGKPVPGCDLRIADDGEILMRGPHIFAGYWNNSQATDEALVDGWLQTGDLGAIDEGGFVTITGRKKDIIITAGGKNLTPANLENDLRQSPWISHAVMYGDRRPYPVAVITLDPEQVLAWAEEQGLARDLASLAAHPAIHTRVQAIVDEANAKYATAAQIKKFTILDHDLSPETGELTPTLKVKRRVVHDTYAAQIEALYATEGRTPR
jgi:long-chain acyl-CoA synthetase